MLHDHALLSALAALSHVQSYRFVGTDVDKTHSFPGWQDHFNTNSFVHTQSKMLSPAAEAFRYFMLEEAESHLAQRFGMHWPKA